MHRVNATDEIGNELPVERGCGEGAAGNSGPQVRICTPEPGLRQMPRPRDLLGSGRPSGGRYDGGMAWLTERRLRGISRRLVAAREELRVADEQLRHLADDADDARLRSIVSQSPADAAERREAEGDAGAMRRHRDDLQRRIADLEARQDALLDEMSAGRTRSGDG